MRFIWNTSCQLHVSLVMTGAQNSCCFFHVVGDELFPDATSCLTRFRCDVLGNTFFSQLVVMISGAGLFPQCGWHNAQI